MLSEAVEFHGHLCPMVALGYRMGKYALKLLGREREKGMKLIAVVEFQNCLADGIQVATGATFGKNLLYLKPLGKFAASFYDLEQNKSLRLVVKNRILEDTLEYGREGERIKNMPMGEERKRKAQKLMEWGKEIVKKIEELKDEELFDIKPAPSFNPEPFPSLSHGYCKSCGELVLESFLKNGVCGTCAGDNL